MTALLTVFCGGLLSSAHCIGMCGGFACAVGARKQSLWPSLLRQLVYSSGRVFTYAFLGTLGGFAGFFLSQYESALFTAQQVFSIVAGVLMLLIGASVLGLLRFNWLLKSGCGSTLTPIFRHFLNLRGWRGLFMAGLANGFLPCGLVYAFLAMAVATSDAIRGGLLMIAFGLGTVPAMVAMGCGSTILGHTMRSRIHKLAGCLVLVAGTVSIYRAFLSPADCCAAHNVPAMTLRAEPPAKEGCACCESLIKKSAPTDAL